MYEGKDTRGVAWNLACLLCLCVGRDGLGCLRKLDSSGDAWHTNVRVLVLVIMFCTFARRLDHSLLLNHLLEIHAVSILNGFDSKPQTW